MARIEIDDERERMLQYRTMLVIGAVVVVVLLLWAARGALFPFLLGLVAAYLLLPLVNLIQRRLPNRGLIGRSRRVIAVLVVYLVAIGLLVGTILTIGPTLVNETFDLIESLPDYADEAREQSDYWNERYEEALPANIRAEIEANLNEIGSVVTSATKTALLATFGTARRVFGFLAGLALLPLWLFYVLKDERRAMDFFYRLWPPGIRQDVRNIVGIADQVLGAYVRGQLILGFAVGIVTFIGLYLLGVSQAVPLAVLAGIFEMVPILGPWLSFVAAAIVVLATDPGKIWAVAILFFLIQQLENTFLVPKIQGDAVAMNPAVIMVLLVVGGAVFGLIGVIAIVPLAAIARDVFIYVYNRLSDEAALPEAPVEG